jgi:branched-chain amino acid transport system substrate-binding protein
VNRATCALLLALAAGCAAEERCGTVAFAAGGPRSVVVVVAESLKTDTLEGPRACFRLDTQPTADEIDQPDAEVALAERLAADRRVVAVVGHLRSRGSLAAARVYGRAGLPQVVPGSTSRLLRIAGPWTFVLAPNDSAQAHFLAAAADSIGARHVLLFYSGEPYGESMVQSIRPALTTRGIGVADEVRLGMGTDVPTLTEAAVRRRPVDAVILMTDVTQAGEIARTIVPIRPGLPLLSGDGAMYPLGLRNAGGAAAESLWIVSLWRPDSADQSVRRFVDRFRTAAGRDPMPTEALGYDALLFAQAAIRAVGPDRSAVRTWLAGPGGAVPPPGHVTQATLHDGPPPEFQLVRLGPPPTPRP